MLQEARQTDETTFEQLQPYMVAILPRLALNYLVLSLVSLLLWLIVPRLLAGIFPSSTATALTFALNVFIFITGWRFLENRNHATALFALYSQYSRQRRNLKALISRESGEEEALSNALQSLQESAHDFLTAAQEQAVEPIRREDS